MSDKRDYCDEWQRGLIQSECYKRAGWACEHCGMEFVEGTTQAKIARRRDDKPVTLTVHHLNGDKDDYRWQNLLVSCQRCHLIVQAKWKPGGVLPLAWDGVPQWLTERGLVYIINPQLALF